MHPLTNTVAKIEQEQPLLFDPLSETEIKTILGHIKSEEVAEVDQDFEVQFCLDFALSTHQQTSTAH